MRARAWTDLRVALCAALMLLAAPHAAMESRPAARAFAYAGGERVITVEILGIDSDTLASVTPVVSVRVVPGASTESAVQLGLQVILSPDLQNQVFLDTSVVATDSAEIRLTRALPPGSLVFFRGTARAAGGTRYFSTLSVTRRVPPWVRLLAPNAPAVTTLPGGEQTFTWTAPEIGTPPGPWMFQFSIVSATTAQTAFEVVTADTTVTVPPVLEINTPYRWSVVARLPDQASYRAESRSVFVLASDDAPRVTLLYQTFPNPFPSATSSSACVWFDLHTLSAVTLDVLDVSYNVVRRLFPGGGRGVVSLPPGRYGRPPAGATGCDDQFSWDGTDQRGTRVLPGVYIVRLRTATGQFHSRMVYRGR